MNKKFANPYVIFYPTVSRDGMPFPINKCIREIQGRSFRDVVAWRGNIIIAKYCESPFSSMVNASIADFPILRNYFMTHSAPQVNTRVLAEYIKLIIPVSHKRVPSLYVRLTNHTILGYGFCEHELLLHATNPMRICCPSITRNIIFIHMLFMPTTFI
jgi:hypothetical protein